MTHISRSTTTQCSAKVVPKDLRVALATIGVHIPDNVNNIQISTNTGSESIVLFSKGKGAAIYFSWEENS